jgi:small subunit ribosomal protein S14
MLRKKSFVRAGDFVGLQKLPKNASPVRLHNRCKLTDLEGTCVNLVSRVTFREMANNGLIPGVKKASW